MPSSKMRLLYIFPSNFEHSGITVKVKGQLSAFQSRYTTRLVHIHYSRKDSPISQAFSGFIFECKAAVLSLFYSKIYMRYNPKTPFIHLWCGMLSFFKNFTIEHNTLLENELLFLGRESENKLHIFLMSILKRTPVLHVAVNEELRKHLCSRFGVKEQFTLYLQNGFEMPVLNNNKVDHVAIQTILSKKKVGQTVAVFCGNGYPWHGLHMIVSLFEKKESVFLIIVGPYASQDLPENAVLSGALSTDTLYALYEYCDFAISTFRWDMLGIHEGSPLKTREYLSFGLPILVNYYDTASDFEELKPFVFNYQESPEIIDRLLSTVFNKEAIRKAATLCLSWREIWKESL